MEENIIIGINKLTKHFPMGTGKFTALSGIDLQFSKGEFTGVIGPSGSGKTTLLNIIGTLDTPSEGEVRVLGQSVGELGAKAAAGLRKSKLGFVFQSYNLLNVHTVFENVEFPLLLLGIESSQRRRMVLDALEWVGLSSKVKSRPAQLSGGECQRVAIARAMVKKPEIVLADEPTANLDAANSHHIIQTMETLNREFKTTFIFATHDEKVISYVRRKVILADGKLAKDEVIMDIGDRRPEIRNRTSEIRNSMMSIKLALRNLIGAGLRTWLNVAVLSFAFVVIIWHKGLLDGWHNQARAETIRWETGGGQLWHPQYDPYDPFTLEDSHGTLPEGMNRMVSDGQLTPLLITQGTVYPSGRMLNVLIKGIDPAQQIVAIPSSRLDTATFAIPAVIGGNMAASARLKKGDVVTLRWRDRNGAFDASDVEIVEVFHAPVPSIDGGQLWIPLEKLREMMLMPGEATLMVMKKGAALPGKPEGWVYKDTTTLLSELDEMIKTKTAGGSILWGILLLLALLAVFDTQVLSIFRRQKEIGTCVALGMTRMQVVGLFTVEGAMHSVLAAFMGAIYGIPLLAFQSIKGLSFPVEGSDYGIAVPEVIYPVYSLKLILTTILIVFLMTTIVSYWPSRKIARMRPTDALRGKAQ